MKQTLSLENRSSDQEQKVGEKSALLRIPSSHFYVNDQPIKNT